MPRARECGSGGLALGPDWPAFEGIAKMMRTAGFELAARPENFLVDEDTHLLAGEEQRAQAWSAGFLTTTQEDES